MSKTVLLTGASGFIALHILNLLLADKHTVIGTVRTQAQATKILDQFKESYPTLNTAGGPQLKFYIVPDIAAVGAFDDVLKENPEIEAVLHTASPFAYGLDKSYEEAYLIPATEGTKNILNAIKEYGKNVKTVVVTSSFAAIVNVDKAGDETFVHTEETWNPIEKEDINGEHRAYQASKKFAERLAREFVKDNDVQFSLTTVNPPFVLGPQFFDEAAKSEKLNTSAEIVNSLLKTPFGEASFLEAPKGLAVDVRDVAKLHVLPLTKPELAGLRLFPVSGAFNGQLLLNLIHEFFPELNETVGKGDPSVDSVAKAKAESTRYDTSATKAVTGLEWRPIDESVRDAVAQILKHRI